MAKEGMKFASEANFKSFMQQYGVFEDLDDITAQIPSGVQIADYALRDVAVLELKTIKSNPGEKLESYFHEIMERPDFPAIYGELNFRKVVGLMNDSEQLIRKFENKAFRQIESVVSKADKQVKEGANKSHACSASAYRPGYKAWFAANGPSPLQEAQHSRQACKPRPSGLAQQSALCVIRLRQAPACLLSDALNANCCVSQSAARTYSHLP